MKLVQNGNENGAKINPAQVDVYSVLLLINHSHAVARNDFHEAETAEILMRKNIEQST